MRSAQETFKAVIEARYYGSDWDNGHFMCWALSRALIAGVITSAERNNAYESVVQYLHELGADELGGVLYHALRSSGILGGDSRSTKEWVDSGDGAEFYLNWDNRPKPWQP